MQKLVFLSDIDLAGSPKVRCEVRGDVVNDYAEAYKQKTKLPAPDVFEIEGQKQVLLADGLHRVTGARVAGLKMLACEVHKGTLEDCLSFALSSNVRHGLRRTHEDKRRCVEAAIAQWPKLSDLELSKRAHVSHTFVADTRRLLEQCGITEEPVTKTSTNGVERPARNSGTRLQRCNNGSPKEDEKPLSDTMGFPIPKDLAHFWQRIPEVKNLISQLRSIRDELVQRQTDLDLMYVEVNIDSAVAEINNAVALLKTAVPYAVCTSCQGKLREKCSLCRGRGLISKYRWDLVPDEIKQLRTKGQTK